MARLVVNRTRYIQYCRADSGEILDLKSLKENLSGPTRRDVDIYLADSSDIPQAPGSYLPVAGLCALPPHTSWWVAPDQYSFADDMRSFGAPPSTFESVLSYAQRRLSKAGRSGLLGVELSGGLDTSIIIEMLLQWQIPFALVGMKSERYEFRTERVVQMLYEKRCCLTCLYSDKDPPAFSQLDQVPPHPYPTIQSLNFPHAYRRVAICRELGITTLLSGDAGDRLFGFAPPQCDSVGRVPQNWAYWNLAQSLWTNQYLFEPQGIRYLSGFAIGRLPAMILQLRSGASEDHMKIFVRRLLKSYLPSILTDYAYKGFHDGWVIDGILAARSVIRKMARITYDITRHPELEPGAMEEAVTLFRRFDARKRERFFNRLSFVVWVYSNNRE